MSKDVDRSEPYWKGQVAMGIWNDAIRRLMIDAELSLQDAVTALAYLAVGLALPKDPLSTPAPAQNENETSPKSG